MNEVEVPPLKGEPVVIGVTDTSTAYDLSATERLGVGAAKGYRYTLQTDDNACFYAFSDSASGTIDPGALTGDARCFYLPAKTAIEVVIQGRPFLHVRTAASTAVLRIALSAKPAGE
jgi:hypothetical protein